MKSFSLLFLGIMLVTGAPHKRSPSEECKLQRTILEEIIEHVKVMKRFKNSRILVKNVITPANCTCDNFRKAGKVLSEYEAEMLGLTEKNWLLPRTLTSYSKNTHCNVKTQITNFTDEVEFHQLLENIKLCAQEKYRDTSCD
ncbi:hypothetical protein HF521_001620 [Silurus meridionalis]|uniref:Interleukin n=1 Tax=Silurus meridionalis TaxID=175797 RepID=A0A8T0B7Z4_SILME|nr:hypothetical protein HF521_001620 [Silurus meridionalis]